MSAVGIQPKLDAYGRVKIPLTAERKRQIAEEMAEGIVELLRDDLMARGREALARGQALAAEGEALKKLADQKKAEAEQHAMNASEHGAKAAEHGAKAAEHGAKAAEHGAKAAEHGAKAAAHGARVAQLGAQQQQVIKMISSQLLVGVFHGMKSLPMPVIEEVFAKFLANYSDAFSFQQEPVTKKPIYEAKTTVPFAEYIEANPGKVTSCDFRVFNEKISDNMENVARALSDPSCAISAVWISSKVSDEAKAHLEKAAQVREGLTINYV